MRCGARFPMNMNRQRNLLVVKNVERETKGSLPVFLAQWGEGAAHRYTIIEIVSKDLA